MKKFLGAFSLAIAFWATLIAFVSSLIFTPILLVYSIFFYPLFVFISLLPAILFYILLFITSGLVVGALRLKRTKLYTVLLILAVSLGIPLLSNGLTFLKIKYLTALDHNKLQNAVAGDTIILNGVHHQPSECFDLCQKLLYNKAFKKVIVVNDTRTRGGSFTIEERDACPSVYYTPDNINLRIASGQCLISEDIDPKEASGDYIYRLEGVSSSSRHSKENPFMLWVDAKRITLIETKHNKKLFQKTTVRAKPLLAPLLITGSGGYQLDFDVAFARYKYHFKDYDTNNENAETVFKEYYSDPPAEDIDQYEIITKDLHSKSEEKLIGHRLFEKHLGSFLFSKKKPSEKDINLVIEALKDLRTNNWGDLWRFNFSLETIPDDLILAMGDRIVKDGNQGVSAAIGLLPNERASIIYPQLLKVIQTPELRKNTMRAITRLSDGGIKSVPEYKKILLEYKELGEKLRHKIINSTERSNLEKRIKSFGEAPQGAVKGLCRLGKDGLDAKDTLISLIIEDDIRFFGKDVIKALIQMGLEEELKVRYKNNDTVLKIISKEVRSKAGRERKNKDVCK